MAGDWIKIEHVTPDKPEVHQLAEMLNIDPDAVVGKLIRIWIWADQQLRSCYAPVVTHSLIDRISCISGFANALESVGWLARKTGEIVFVNFDNHNGTTAKARALAMKRMQRFRYDSGVTSASPEKRREEKNSNTPLPPASGGSDPTQKPNSQRRPTRRDRQRSEEAEQAAKQRALNDKRKREAAEAGQRAALDAAELRAARELWEQLPFEYRNGLVGKLLKERKWQIAGEDLAREEVMRQYWISHGQRVA